MQTKKYYAASTQGFYDREIHGSRMPDDALEISQEHYDYLFDGHYEGHSIQPDEDGLPMLVSHEVSEEEAQENLRILGIQQQLADIDTKRLQAITAAILKGDKTKLQALEDHADALRKQLKPQG